MANLIGGNLSAKDNEGHIFSPTFESANIGSEYRFYEINKDFIGYSEGAEFRRKPSGDK